MAFKGPRSSLSNSFFKFLFYISVSSEFHDPKNANRHAPLGSALRGTDQHPPYWPFSGRRDNFNNGLLFQTPAFQLFHTALRTTKHIVTEIIHIQNQHALVRVYVFLVNKCNPKKFMCPVHIANCPVQLLPDFTSSRGKRIARETQIVQTTLYETITELHHCIRSRITTHDFQRV